MRRRSRRSAALNMRRRTLNSRNGKDRNDDDDDEIDPCENRGTGNRPRCAATCRGDHEWALLREGVRADRQTVIEGGSAADGTTNLQQRRTPRRPAAASSHSGGGTRSGAVRPLDAWRRTRSDRDTDEAETDEAADEGGDSRESQGDGVDAAAAGQENGTSPGGLLPRTDADCRPDPSRLHQTDWRRLRTDRQGVPRMIRLPRRVKDDQNGRKRGRVRRRLVIRFYRRLADRYRHWERKAF